MKLFADQDVYACTVKLLRESGHDVVTASERSMSQSLDSKLLVTAGLEGRVLITRDRDYGGLVFSETLGLGVIYLRLLPLTIDYVHAELLRVLSLYQQAKLLGTFIVIEQDQHRVRRPRPIPTVDGEVPRMTKSELPFPENDGDRKMLANIVRVGWAVLGIPGDEEGPGYGFSIGLYRTFGHPEIILIGLPWETTHRCINSVGAAIEAGMRYEAGKQYDDVAEGFLSAFELVDPSYYKAYIGTAGWFYQGWNFPVLQLVWPDRDGVFPWEPNAKPGHQTRQPLLSVRSKIHPS